MDLPAVVEDEGCHVFYYGDDARDDAGVVSAVGFDVLRVSVVVDGLLQFGDR